MAYLYCFFMQCVLAVFFRFQTSIYILNISGNFIPFTFKQIALFKFQSLTCMFIIFSRDEALKKCSELRMELTSSKHDMQEELTSLDQCKGDQIAILKVELRNEMNQLHEVSEQVNFIFY